MLNGEKVEGRSFTQRWARKKEAHMSLQAACGEFIATLPPFIDLQAVLRFYPSKRVMCVMREKLIIFQTTMCEIQQIFKALTSVTSACKIF